MIETLLFAAAAGCTVVGALGAATVRNLFHAALLLGLALVGTAALYLFLEAQWLACVQVVVYVGGILVLVLFATLFSSDILGRVQRAGIWMRLAGAAGAALAAFVAVRLLAGVLDGARDLAPTRSAPGAARPLDGSGTTTGDLLLTSWFVPFLLAALLLTAALIAAVATVQRFRRQSPPAEAIRG